MMKLIVDQANQEANKKKRKEAAMATATAAAHK
jgi:hypothetical protein